MVALTVAAPALAGSQAPGSLAFTVVPSSVAAGGLVGAVTAQARDTAGQPLASGAVVFTLSGDAHFEDASDPSNTSVKSVTVPVDAAGNAMIGQGTTHRIRAGASGSVTISATVANSAVAADTPASIPITTTARELRLLGLGDAQYAKVTYDDQARAWRIVSGDVYPHSYFTDAQTPYVTLQVVGADGTVKYTKKYIGNQRQPGDATVPYAAGDELRVTSQEPDRVRLVNAADGSEVQRAPSGLAEYGIEDGTIGLGRPVSGGSVVVGTRTQAVEVFGDPGVFDATGTLRGIYMGRQNLGVMVPRGVKLRIRQTNPAHTGDVTVKMYTNDGNTEVEAQVGSAWVEVVNPNADSVPFVSNPVGGNPAVQPVVEYEVVQEMRTLAVYRAGGDPQAFLGEWANSGAGYAVLEDGRSVTLANDNDYAVFQGIAAGGNGYGSLDAWLANVTGTIEEFDDMLGLDGPGSADYRHRNLPGRYFFKPDVNGAGGAYYSPYHYVANSANNASGVVAYGPAAWITLHEIGHGYQFPGVGMYTGEVTNNIFAYYRQNDLTGGPDDNSWLYQGEGMAAFQQRVESGVADGAITYDNASLHDKLYFWVKLMDRIGGKEGFRAYNRAVREHILANGTGTPTADLIAQYAAQVANANPVPYLEGWGITVSPAVQASVESSYPTPLFP